MILFVNCCPRKDSRTLKITKALLCSLGDEYTELNLYNEALLPLTEEMLNKRTELVARREYFDPMFAYAKQFATADTIVVAAPYWDFSFPSMLKVYIENIYVVGIVSEYTESGIPRGLCRAKKLYYVTTAGGPYFADFSYEYIKSLAKQCMGIDTTELICAEKLDMKEYSADEIVSDVIHDITTKIQREKIENG